MAFFRRSFSIEDERKVKGKAGLLTLALVMVLVLANVAWYFMNDSSTIHIINIKMLDKNQIIVESDTTNYDQFASTLKNAVIIAKQNYKQNKILLSVPKNGTSSEVADIIMIVTAMNLEWQIKN